MTAATVSINVAAGGGAHTILDLPHAGFEVVERQIAHFVFQAVEIHGGGCDGRSVLLRRRRSGSLLWSGVPGFNSPGMSHVEGVQQGLVK